MSWVRAPSPALTIALTSADKAGRCEPPAGALPDLLGFLNSVERSLPMPDDPRPDDVKDTGTAVAEQSPEGGEAAPVKLEQVVEMTDIGPCKKHIKVTIDRKSIDAKLAEKYKKIVPESNVA